MRDETRKCTKCGKAYVFQLSGSKEEATDKDAAPNLCGDCVRVEVVYMCEVIDGGYKSLNGHLIACPACGNHELKNTGTMSTLGGYMPHQDEHGRWHTHDHNLRHTSYLCSCGCTFALKHRLACWCGWSADPAVTCLVLPHGQVATHAEVCKKADEFQKKGEVRMADDEKKDRDLGSLDLGKYVLPICRQVPPWFPIEAGGRGEIKALPLCSVQPMGQKRGISGSAVFMFLDRHFRDWVCPECGKHVPAGFLECPVEHCGKDSTPEDPSS